MSETGFNEDFLDMLRALHATGVGGRSWLQRRVALSVFNMWEPTFAVAEGCRAKNK